jgi:hypothetical protein
MSRNLCTPKPCIAALPRHRRQAHEHRRALALPDERRGLGDLAQRAVALEVAVRRGAARMPDVFGNALVFEVRDLLALPAEPSALAMGLDDFLGFGTIDSGNERQRRWTRRYGTGVQALSSTMR